MKVIISGGSGYFGLELIKTFLNKNIQILNIDIQNSNLSHKNLIEINKDITEINLNDLFNFDASTFIHLAGFADLNYAYSKPHETLKHNVEMSIKMIEICYKLNIKNFIFSSSMYANGKHGGFYGVSKKCAELYLNEFASQKKINLSIIRVGSLYGGNSKESNGLHSIIKKVLKGEKIEYNGNENNLRNYIHVNDASNSVFEILKGLKSGSYNLVGRDQYKIKDVFLIISEILGVNIEINYKNVKNNKHYNYSPYSIKTFDRTLEVKNQIDFGSGIKELHSHIINSKNKIQ